MTKAKILGSTQSRDWIRELLILGCLSEALACGRRYGDGGQAPKTAGELEIQRQLKVLELRDRAVTSCAKNTDCPGPQKTVVVASASNEPSTPVTEQDGSEQASDETYDDDSSDEFDSEVVAEVSPDVDWSQALKQVGDHVQSELRSTNVRTQATIDRAREIDRESQRRVREENARERREHLQREAQLRREHEARAREAIAEANRASPHQQPGVPPPIVFEKPKPSPLPSFAQPSPQNSTSSQPSVTSTSSSPGTCDSTAVIDGDVVPLSECIETIRSDPRTYGWMALRNKCARKINLEYAGDLPLPNSKYGYHNSMVLTAGQQGSTGHTYNELGGLSYVVCPENCTVSASDTNRFALWRGAGMHYWCWPK